MIHPISNKHQILPYKNTNMKCKTKKSTVKKYPREYFCRYSFYSCGRKRAVKPDGELHTLCEKHREEANRNQRELSKRRQEKRILSKQLSNTSLNGIDTISMVEYMNSIDISLLPMESSIQSFSTSNDTLLNDNVSWNGGQLNSVNVFGSQIPYQYQVPNVYQATTPISIPTTTICEQNEYDLNSHNIDWLYESCEQFLEPLQMKDEEIEWLDQLLRTQSLPSTLVNV